MFRSGRRYEIRIDSRYDDDVVLLDSLFGFLAAFVFKLSVPVVYVILMSDEIIKIPITYKRYRSYKWTQRCDKITVERL